MNESSSKNPKQVILYSTDWCIKCRNLKRALDALKISYEVRDPDESINELPTLDYDNHRYSGELSLRELKEILGV